MSWPREAVVVRAAIDKEEMGTPLAAHTQLALWAGKCGRPWWRSFLLPAEVHIMVSKSLGPGRGQSQSWYHIVMKSGSLS